jgi:hypothetical protein
MPLPPGLCEHATVLFVSFDNISLSGPATIGVMNAKPTLSNMPLWRLLVALDDAERTAGPDSESARLLAKAVQAKMKQARQRENKERTPPCEG